LNKRFHGGHASNQLAEAGVLVRNFDGTTVSGQPWLPCPREIQNGCAIRGDRFPGTLINEQLPTVISYAPGFVISPSHVELLCSYHADGATDGKLCDSPGVSEECIPGCWKKSGWRWGEALWCERPSARNPRGIMYGCAWKREALSGMIESHLERGKKGYNEVVYDAEVWVANLPHTIEAIFVQKLDALGWAKQMRNALIDSYELTEQTAPPIVQYDREKATSASPFALRRPGQDET
jgi:hypothetical protein